MTYLAVFIGGGLGSVCRFLLSRFNGEETTLGYIAGTLLANMVSCFILGALLGYQGGQSLGENTKLLLTAGFCGGFSTFSTFSYEALYFVQKGQTTLAAAYVAMSVISGLILVGLGMKWSASF